MPDNTTPLIVDIDGSLLQTDLLVETFWKGLGTDFFHTLKIIIANILNPAALKQKLARSVPLDYALLPVDENVLTYVRDAQLRGRSISLVSGADQMHVDALAERFEITGRHFGSDGTHNLTGMVKADLLVDSFGNTGFDYIGNETRDLKIWRYARRCIVVKPTARLLDRAKALQKPIESLGARWAWGDVLRGLRPFQWVKNLLLLLPAIAIHNSDLTTMLPVAVAFVAFSMGASAIYIINDLLDLEADRQHPKKKLRPFAAGQVPLSIGMAAATVLMFAALMLSALVNVQLVGVIAVYMATSLAYSLRLKRIRWVDVGVLAWLYTLRVLAGGVVVVVPLSGWLLVFVFAIFLSLGSVKRLTELSKATHNVPLPGRGYGRADISNVRNVAIIGAVVGVGVFLAYTFSATASTLYTNLWALRITSVPIALWLIRMILTGWQGKQDYDPIIFAAKDTWGLVLVLIGAVLLGYSV